MQFINTHLWWENLPFTIKKTLWENAFGTKLTRNRKRFLHSELLTILQTTQLRISYFRNEPLNMEWLAPLEGLTKIDLWMCRLSTDTLDFVRHFSNLEHLSVYDCRLRTITALATVDKLATLSVSANQISDLSPLEDLTNLRLLDIAKNAVPDLSPLEKLTCLQHLNIQENPVSDLSALKKLKKLTFFSAYQQSFRDLSPFGALPHLHTLELIRTQFGNPDLSPLLNLPDLREVQLNASFTGRSLAPLADLPHLHTVSSWLRGLTVVDQFLNFTQLKRLNIKNNPLQSGELEKIRKVLPDCVIE